MNIIHAAKAINIMSPPINLAFAPSLLLEVALESDFELESVEEEDGDPEEEDAELGGESVVEVVVLVESEEPASLKIFASGESGERFRRPAKHHQTTTTILLLN